MNRIDADEHARLRIGVTLLVEAQEAARGSLCLSRNGDYPSFKSLAQPAVELGRAFANPDDWTKVEPCSMPLTPFKPCTGRLYRPVSPGEQASGAVGAPLFFIVTVALPGDSELGIMGAVTGQGHPSEGVYLAVRRLPRPPIASGEYFEAMQTRLRSAIRATGASVLEIGSREIGFVFQRIGLSAECPVLQATPMLDKLLVSARLP